MYLRRWDRLKIDDWIVRRSILVQTSDLTMIATERVDSDAPGAAGSE
jgi:hypothetical protein